MLLEKFHGRRKDDRRQRGPGGSEIEKVSVAFGRMADTKNSAANPRRLSGQSSNLFDLKRRQNRRFDRLFINRQTRELDGKAWKTWGRLKPHHIQRRRFVDLRDRRIPALIKN